MEKKLLTVEEFTLLAIDRLPTNPRFKHIHTVYSHFNQAFKEYFKGQGLAPIVEVKKLVEAGKISFRFCRGGALIARPGVLKESGDSESALKKMGI